MPLRRGKAMLLLLAGDDGAEFIIEGVTKAPSPLQWIELEENPLSKEMAKKLEQALEAKMQNAQQGGERREVHPEGSPHEEL